MNPEDDDDFDYDDEEDYTDQMNEDKRDAEEARFREMDLRDEMGYSVRSAHCWL